MVACAVSSSGSASHRTAFGQELFDGYSTTRSSVTALDSPLILSQACQAVSAVTGIPRERLTSHRIHHHASNRHAIPRGVKALDAIDGESTAARSTRNPEKKTSTERRFRREPHKPVEHEVAIASNIPVERSHERLRPVSKRARGLKAMELSFPRFTLVIV